MRASNETNRVRSGFEGGERTGRFDRGLQVAAPGDIAPYCVRRGSRVEALVLRDVVHDGDIATHALYGAATPHVGSAWALPRSHPLWAPMDFEARQLAEPKDRSAELAKFEPPAVPRPELSAADVASLRCENVKRFQAQQLEPDSGRVEFIPCANFKGRKAGFYWGRGAPGGVAGDVGEPAAASTAESSFGDLRLGYHVDFAQMRHLMALSPGDRCEARYDKVRRMFRGAVLNAHDDDCSYDVRFEHGHVRHRVPAEHVLKSDWVGECKETDGIHRTLKAANPLLETKDAAVRWYEQVLLWEQGKVDRPTAPAAGGRYRAAAPAPAADLRGDAGPPPPEYETAVGGLTAPSTAAARDEAPSDDVAEASVEDASTHQPYSESSARTEDGGGCWDRFRLVGVPPAPPPDESGGVAERGPTAVVQTDMGASAAGDDITIQAVVASGDVWRPASAGYRHFWDADGRPRKRGPPTHLSWYGAADDAADSGPADVDTTENIPGMSAGEAPLEAQSDGAPLDLCGDGSLFKHSLRSGLARVVEAPFGGVSIVPRGHAERERAEQTDAPPLKGRRPVAGCLCTCHIIVTRLDGTAVESSYDSNSKRPLTFTLFSDTLSDDKASNVYAEATEPYVQGLHEALASMRAGETAHFLIAPEKAFGKLGRPPYVRGAPDNAGRGDWLRYGVDLVALQQPIDGFDADGGAALVLASARQLQLRQGGGFIGNAADRQAAMLLATPGGYSWDGQDAESTSVFNDEKRCAWCGKPGRLSHNGKKFKRCARCKAVIYCSVECAAAAWPGHRDSECSASEDHTVLKAFHDVSRMLAADAARGAEESGIGAEAPRGETQASAVNADDGDAAAPDGDDTTVAHDVREHDARATGAPLDAGAAGGVLSAAFSRDGALQHRVALLPFDRALSNYLQARQRGRPPRICVIVAFRNQLPLQDRQPQLFKFVPYLVAYLSYARPSCSFTIVVATQADDGRKFNRGRLMNAAFQEMCCGHGAEAFDSVIFHDVDILPSVELMPFYAVPPQKGRPLHIGGAWRTKYRASDFCGGAIAFTPGDFEQCNGYPNDCWGWGLDDAELRLRALESGLRMVKPPAGVGSFSDLDPINMKNVVFSEERGYYHEWWNMDLENGKVAPKVTGQIDWATYKQHYRERGLSDIRGHSELLAKTHEFGGRVVRLLFQVQNDVERREAVVALISARQCLKASLDARLVGPVAEHALQQTRQYAAMGNLKADRPRSLDANRKLLTDDKLRLQGRAPPPALQGPHDGAVALGQRTAATGRKSARRLT